MTDIDSIGSIPLDIVDQLLGAPPGYPSWRIAYMANRAGVLATWLSSAIARGVPISDAAQTHLTRARHRVETLHRIGGEMAGAHGVTVIKGPKIAGRYPKPLLRQSGDIDLVAADQPALWACVAELADRYGATADGVSVLDGADVLHVGVFLKWPADEPELDKPMGADITTCAFSGDLKGVPVRADMPADEDVCGLFAVAEERFQHSYRIKDLLDFLVLSAALEARLGADLAPVICVTADELALAPELRKLIGKTAGRAPVSAAWLDIWDRLKPLAAAEKARRRPDRAGMYRLRYGFPLDDRRARDLTIVARRGFDVATTPAGTCLLVTDRVIDEDILAEAQSYARSVW